MSIRNIVKLCLEIDRYIYMHFSSFKMEFYLLRSAFETMFHYVKRSNDEKKNPEDEYKNHINEFIDGLKKIGKVSPELEFL